MSRGWLSRNPPPWMIRKTGFVWTIYRRKPVAIGSHYIGVKVAPSWREAMEWIGRVPA